MMAGRKFVLGALSAGTRAGWTLFKSELIGVGLEGTVRQARIANS